MKHTNVLFLCAETFPPVYVFLDHVWNRILPQAGYNCFWIMPSPGVTQISETRWGRNRVWLIPKVRSGGLIHLITGYISHLRFVQRAAEQALAKTSPVGILQVRDDPIMAYVAWRLSRRDNIPFAYQMSHLKEEENILYAKMNLYGSPLTNYVKGQVGLLLRNWLLRQADLVFPISDRMGDTLAGYGVKRERMVVLPEGVDTSTPPTRFDNAARNIRRLLGLQRKKVLIYVGTMSRFRQLDFLLCVLKQLIETHPDVHLLMVGGGRDPGDLPWLEELAHREGVSGSVSFTGKVLRSQAQAYIRASNIGLSPIPTNPVYLNSSPIKTLEYLAMGVPCIGSDVPDQYRVIAESGGGLCVSYDVPSFIRAVSRLLAIPDEQLRRMGERGRKYVAQHRDFAVLAEVVARSYERLLTQHGQ